MKADSNKSSRKLRKTEATFTLCLRELKEREGRETCDVQSESGWRESGMAIRDLRRFIAPFFSLTFIFSRL